MVFSLANSVLVKTNTCVFGQQEVSSEHDRKPGSALLGILHYFGNLSHRYGIDINAWDRHIMAKKCNKYNEKVDIETSSSYFDNAFINTAS